MWDLLWPLIVATGGGSCLWIIGLPHLALVLPLFLLTKRATVRMDHEQVTITWWWACVPFRRRRYLLTSGRFDDDGCSYEPPEAMAIGFLPAGQHALGDDDKQFICFGAGRVVALLEAERQALAVPTARIVER